MSASSTAAMIDDQMEILAHVYGYSLTRDGNFHDAAGGVTTYYRFRSSADRFKPTITITVRNRNGAYYFSTPFGDGAQLELSNKVRAARDNRKETFWLGEELDDPFDIIKGWFMDHNLKA